jgi:hypothetical protein
MKINVIPRASVDVETTRFYKELAQQVNGLSEGRLSASYGALTAAPTTGTWAKGDYIRNSNPSEAGVALSKYVIHGWICTVAGTPGTWLQDRRLTGN